MIHYQNVQANTATTITTVITGVVIPTDLVLFKDGVVDLTSVTFNNLTPAGLCTFSLTPASTGVYTLYGQGVILAVIEVVARSPLSYLKNLEDECLGSWQWDKVSGVMSMLRQDGTQLAQFKVIDNLTSSSRERS